MRKLRSLNHLRRSEEGQCRGNVVLKKGQRQGKQITHPEIVAASTCAAV